MSNTTATATEIYPKELFDLADAIKRQPPDIRAALAAPLKTALDAAARLRLVLTLVQDTLQQIRLDIKFLTFDLEATRRERDAAKGL
jgi:hypothetical protein